MTIAIAALTAMTACAPGSQQEASKQSDAKQHAADERLRAIYAAEWKWREDQFADDEDAQKPISDHLPKVDPAAQDARLRYWEDVLRKLDEIPQADLSGPEQVNYAIYRPRIQVLIADQR